MAVKLLAGLVAALLATGVGVFVAFSGGGPEAPPPPAPTETLPVSEGSCCVKTFELKCPVAIGACPASAQPEALGACTGSAALAAPAPKARVVGCCDE